ncbi:peptidoglycan-binding protein [Streptomyces nogalater]
MLWAHGSSGPGVRELQARLRQVGWLSAAPTGTYGPQTERAVRGSRASAGCRPPAGWTPSPGSGCAP